MGISVACVLSPTCPNDASDGAIVSIAPAGVIARPSDVVTCVGSLVVTVTSPSCGSPAVAALGMAAACTTMDADAPGAIVPDDAPSSAKVCVAPSDASHVSGAPPRFFSVIDLSTGAAPAQSTR